MKLCVHGLGYVGLATASLFANNGYEVVGFDTDPSVIETLRSGDVDLPEADLAEYVREALATNLSVSDVVVEADCHVVCVPTPYDNGPELTYVEQAATAIGNVLQSGDTVVVESTVPPGTTTGLVAQSLETSGLDAGEEFALAYTPETILPGNTVPELRNNDRIVGGIDNHSAELVCDLYGSATAGEIHRAPDATTAEFIKLSQNAFRDVNIAYANELARIAAEYGVAVRHAIDLANTHPRVDILNPGPGVGGHCLPVDPLFLSHGSENAPLIETAREVNDEMAAHVVARLREELGPLAGRRVAILGIAYKGNVSESRNSPGLAVAHALKATELDSRQIADGGSNAVDVRLSDPHVEEPLLDLHPIEQALTGADAAIITAGHDEFGELDPSRVSGVLKNDVIFDAVDILDSATWREHGFAVLDV
jgi:UDP-N-acetyl-D-mannosaminuronic acid dehydrogenase